MAGIGWAPLGGEWWTWQWCLPNRPSAQPALPQRGAASRKACIIAGCGAAFDPVAQRRGPRVAPACVRWPFHCLRLAGHGLAV
jgi:hypothetical protein